MIATFYSFKGGVGRSMALVNVGELLAREGFSVVLVDWDLEAPGLERYFMVRPEEIAQQKGVIDLLDDYKEAMTRADLPEFPDDTSRSEQLSTLGFTSPADYYTDVGSLLTLAIDGSLHLLPAGRRDPFAEYARRVQSFDWSDFYARWAGQEYLEWLRKELLASADVVLVDSRTGVTEVGGVCVYHLADTVVLFSAPNQGNIAGTEQMAEAFTRPVVQELRGGRELAILPVPARVPSSEETELINDFISRFADRLGRFYEGFDVDPDEFARRLVIPQIAQYTFGERVAVRELGDSKYRRDDLRRAYLEVTKAIARLAPEGDPLRDWAHSGEPAARRASLEAEAAAVDRAVLDRAERVRGFALNVRRALRNQVRRARLKRLAAPAGAAALVLIMRVWRPSAATAFGPLGRDLVQSWAWLLLGTAAIALLVISIPRRGDQSDMARVRVDQVLQRLDRDRAAYVVRQGIFYRRVQPNKLLEETLTAAEDRLSRVIHDWIDEPVESVDEDA